MCKSGGETTHYDRERIMSTVTSTSGNNTASVPKTAEQQALEDAKKQKDQFLKILLTQLQNQNPLDPQKPEQFSQQLAQYSSLEQQIQTNTKLETLLSSLNKNAVSPVSYLGTTVDYDSAVAPVQGGYAEWDYVAAGAASVNLEVKDADGKVIYSGNGSVASGKQSLSLEATGAPDGVPLTLTVTAKDAEGKVITPTITSRAKITAVSSADGVTTLEANGYVIDSAKVKRIATTKAAANDNQTETNS